MTAQTIFGIFVIPAIIGLVEVAKDLGLPTRAAPALSVLFGIGAAMAQLFSGQWPWLQTIVIGIALGLSACGLYAGVKTIVTPGATVIPLLETPLTPFPTPATDTAPPPPTTTDGRTNGAPPA